MEGTRDSDTIVDIYKVIGSAKKVYLIIAYLLTSPQASFSTCTGQMTIIINIIIIKVYFTQDVVHIYTSNTEYNKSWTATMNSPSTAKGYYIPQRPTSNLPVSQLSPV